MNHSIRQISRPLSLPATAILLLVAGLLTGGSTCPGSSPDAVGLKTEVDYLVQESDSSGSNLEDQFLGDLREADRRIWGAIAGDMMDQQLAQILVDAHKAGVDVRLVADVDDQSEPGFTALREAGVPISWGNGQLNYLPGPYLGQILTKCERNDSYMRVECRATGEGETPSSPDGCEDPAVSGNQGTMCRPGDFNLMSHRFAIVDKRTVWNFAAGFGDGSTGDLGWRAESEYIRKDFVREFRQMEGGVFATELDAFNGPIKSTTDSHVDYLTDKGRLQIRFNPQERLMKHVIDDVYRAKHSIQIVTRSLTNPFLLDALEDKQNRGFDIDIVVGADTQPQGEARQRLVGLGAQAHPSGENLPSVILRDHKEGSDRNWPRSAMVLSHPLWHGSPFSVLPPENPNETEASDRVRVYPSDHFVDGNMWRIREFRPQPDESPQIDKIADFVDTAISRSSAL
jgi:phosphatidylserine/phosphatidylglycerophosphate/cardiolipin synthase-like enzyme